MLQRIVYSFRDSLGSAKIAHNIFINCPIEVRLIGFPYPFINEMDLNLSMVNRTSMVVDEISNLEPDIIVSDYEPYSIYAARALGIPCIVISPMMLAKQFKIFELLMPITVAKLARVRYSYSVFGDIYPYTNGFNLQYKKNRGKYIISGGTTLDIAEAFSAGISQPIFVKDSFNNEDRLNSQLFCKTDFGRLIKNTPDKTYLSEMIERDFKPFSTKGVLFHDIIQRLF